MSAMVLQLSTTEEEEPVDLSSVKATSRINQHFVKFCEDCGQEQDSFWLGCMNLLTADELFICIPKQYSKEELPKGNTF